MSTPNATAMRIIDANLNRAREALRVMEEYARLGLDDAGLSAAIKETRHALATAAAQFEGGRESDAKRATARAPDRSGFHSARASSDSPNSLIRARDIVGDVGCEVGTSAEYQRAGALHVAMAAGKRLSEALRAVEEYGKTIDRGFAAAIEKIRYRGYELERRLGLTASARQRFGHVRLYVILTESLCSGEWLATAEAAIRGGADCLQLREKDLSDRELLDRAKRLSKLCHDHDTMFIVNDRVDIAVLSGADGVHLGQDDLSVAAVRRIVPSTCLVGVSTHDVEQVEAAAGEAPDYIAVGPMLATSTKPQDHIAGPQTLAAARRLTSLPLVAIGGIDEHNAAEVLSAGADCLCVCTSVIAQADVAKAAEHLRAVVDQAAAGPTSDQ
ncbi:MAG: thiamine phosphate synthase [Phycisphaerales bacterium]|nr:MAG: thiamine phosphate synthase [Phycisphaerales bacterium]